MMSAPLYLTGAAPTPQAEEWLCVCGGGGGECQTTQCRVGFSLCPKGVRVGRYCSASWMVAYRRLITYWCNDGMLSCSAVLSGNLPTSTAGRPILCM